MKKQAQHCNSKRNNFACPCIFCLLRCTYLSIEISSVSEIVRPAVPSPFLDMLTQAPLPAFERLDATDGTEGRRLWLLGFLGVSADWIYELLLGNGVSQQRGLQDHFVRMHLLYA